MQCPAWLPPLSGTTGSSSAAGTRVESGRFRAGVAADDRGATWGSIDFGPAISVADSVLYKGYLLYPHRGPAQKDKPIWQFGVLAPRSWVEARQIPSGEAGGMISSSTESWWNRTECLVEADLEARMEVRLRYLQAGGDACGGHFVDALPREATVAFTLGEVVDSGIVVTVDGGDRLQARYLVSASMPPSPFQLYKLTVRVENAVRLDASETRMARDEVLRRSLIATHVLLGVENGSFLSLTDPPQWAGPAVDTCRNVRAFPVLAGPLASCGIVLSAPIRLHDHPRVVREREDRLPRVC